MPRVTFHFQGYSARCLKDLENALESSGLPLAVDVCAEYCESVEVREAILNLLNHYDFCQRAHYWLTN